MRYPPPADNDNCQCQHPMQSMFCSFGHMLECHYPYSCQDAGCSHLLRYDWSPGQVAELMKRAVERIRAEGDPYGYLVEDGC